MKKTEAEAAFAPIIQRSTHRVELQHKKEFKPRPHSKLNPLQQLLRTMAAKHIKKQNKQKERELEETEMFVTQGKGHNEVRDTFTSARGEKDTKDGVERVLEGFRQDDEKRKRLKDWFDKRHKEASERFHSQNLFTRGHAAIERS